MENLNAMVHLLRSKLADLKEVQAELNRSIQRCKDTIHQSSKDEVIKKIEDLAEQGKRLEEKLGYFKVIS